MSNHKNSVSELAAQVEILVMDVDGVLTDGKIHYTSDQELFKSFSIKDGLGIKLLQKNGIECAVITGRQSTALEKRCTELGIEHLVQSREDKRTALQELTDKLRIPMNKVAYIGDDLPDIGAIVAAGLGASVADAHIEVQKRADWVSERLGGTGAVRELADFILISKNLYQSTIADFL